MGAGPVQSDKTNSLSVQVFIAMILAALVGLMLQSFNEVAWVRSVVIDGILDLVGAAFVASLKMLVIPLVFFSIVCGIAGLDDATKLGRVGLKSIALYMFTTCIAISVAIALATLVSPGDGFNLAYTNEFTGVDTPTIPEMLKELFPANPIKAAADGRVLQIIVFAILFGIGCLLAGKHGKNVINISTDLGEVIMRIVTILLHLAPYGVFALLCKVFAEQGIDALLPLAKYFALVLGVLFVQCLLIYPILLRTLSGLNPVSLIKMRSTMMFAFSTASSNATLPVTMKNVVENLGVRKNVAAFTIPLGATINMDGTAIMQGVATVFISQAYNVPIDLAGYLTVIVTATLASIGTAGVPGVGLIMLTMVLRQAGLPVEGIGLIIGVDRILDMSRTAVNVLGDSVVTCIVAKSENSLDAKIYNRNLRGELA